MEVRQADYSVIEQAAKSAGVELINVRQKGKGWLFRLGLASDKKFRRLSRRGHKVNAVCFHGHRQFMARLFELAPEAILKSAMATYRGQQDFLNHAGEVAQKNIGSMFEPCSYGQACEC